MIEAQTYRSPAINATLYPRHTSHQTHREESGFNTLIIVLARLHRVVIMIGYPTPADTYGVASGCERTHGELKSFSSKCRGSTIARFPKSTEQPSPVSSFPVPVALSRDIRDSTSAAGFILEAQAEPSR